MRTETATPRSRRGRPPRAKANGHAALPDGILTAEADPGQTPPPNYTPRRRPLRIPPELQAWARQRSERPRDRVMAPTAKDGRPLRPFDIPKDAFPPVVLEALKQLEAKTPLLAQDEGFIDNASWANQAAGAFVEGTAFLGFAFLATLAQRPEFRVASEEIAGEATREWIEIKSKGGGNAKAQKIKEIQDDVETYKLQEVFRDGVEGDGLFGRGHVYIDTGDTDNPDELKTPLGNSSDETSRTKVPRGKLRGFKYIEAAWCYPLNYNSTDPLDDNWYNPQSWVVMSKEVHCSRLLTLIGRKVTDMLKPAYAFGGLSMSQMMLPYVDNWLRTRQSVADLIEAFSLMVLATDMGADMGEGNADLFGRLDFFNNTRNIRGMIAVDKETEEVTNVSTPLGTLDALQAQSQEHLASVTRIPIVKLLGIQPAGLNACLVGDTMIETDVGQVLIRNVRPGHKVMTRDGWALVAKAGCTAYTTELVEIEVGGATIRCTANHPIWLPSINEFVPAGNVRPGHLLLCRGGINENQKTGNRSHTGDDFGGRVGTATTAGLCRMTAEIRCFTEKFGEFITGLFPKDIISTTLTKIARTISSRIFSCFQQPSMQKFMALSMASPLGYTFTSHQVLNVSAATVGNRLRWRSRRELNFAATRVDSRTAGNTGSRGPNRALSAFAAFAASFSRRKGATPSTAPENAQPLAKTEPRTADDITKNTQRNGRYQTRTESAGMSCAVSSVQRVPADEFVYDIQVAPGYLPEFFANGICVHNSSEGEIRSYFDWIHAFQEKLIREPLTVCINFIQLNRYGEVDPDITFVFKDLWQLDDAAEAGVQQTKATTHEAYLNMAVVQPEDIRKSISTDPASPYAGIELAELPPPPPPDMAGLMGGAPPGGDPGGQPPPHPGAPHPGGAGAPAFTPPHAPPGAGSAGPASSTHVVHVGPGGGRDSYPFRGANNQAALSGEAADAFDPTKHPRGQPQNRGQFAPGGHGAASPAPAGTSGHDPQQAPPAPPPAAAPRPAVARPVMGITQEARDKVSAIVQNHWGSLDEADSRSIANIIATGVGFDPNRIKIDPGEPREFDIGGKTYEVAGESNRQNGQITMWPAAARPAEYPGYVAHECQHQRWAAVHHAYEEGRPGFREALDPLLTGDGIARLQADDGCTPYSKSIWADWKVGRASTSLAIDETLAEVARLDFMGIVEKIPESVGDAWKQFYDKVGELYPQVAGWPMPKEGQPPSLVASEERR